MISRRRAVLALLAALFIFALPAAASAVTYTVDSTGESGSRTGVCDCGRGGNVHPAGSDPAVERIDRRS